MTTSDWMCGVLALGLSFALTPIMERICIDLHLYDFPGPLKIHSQPIPRLGGVAITLALGLAVGQAALHPGLSRWPFTAALSLVCATGLLDDIRGLSPGIRILAQFAGAALLWQAGWRLPFMGNGALGLCGTSLFVIVFVNAFNFLDGADGIAAGVTAVIALGYVVLPGGAHSQLGDAIAWSLLGVCCGFLAFNFPPASIFMGDSGSTALGFGVAFLGLDFYRASAVVVPSLSFPILVAALPLLDAALAVIRRVQDGASPLHGDRRHFYDLILARGWPSRKVSITCYALTGALVSIASLARRAHFAYSLILLAISAGALLIPALRMGVLRTADAGHQAEQMRT